jgi:hypothetical protein
LTNPHVVQIFDELIQQNTEIINRDDWFAGFTSDRLNCEHIEEASWMNLKVES